MIKVGTCGLSFSDWVGTVYPKGLKSSDMLRYYSRNLGFDLVEIDVAYYTLVKSRTVEGWARGTPDEFKFAVKCHRGMTLNQKTPVDPRTVDNRDLFRAFTETQKPILSSGKALTYLAQFGPVFFRNRQNIDYLKLFRERLPQLPLTVEFRHNSWLSPESIDDTFRLLREHNLGYAVVDEPAKRSLPAMIPGATNDIAYVRLHGRSSKWFEGDASLRYDYLYSDEELMEFIPVIRGLESGARIAVVLFNNCHAGAALKNAIKLKQLLGLAGVFKEMDTPRQLEMDF